MFSATAPAAAAPAPAPPNAKAKAEAPTSTTRIVLDSSLRNRERDPDSGRFSLWLETPLHNVVEAKLVAASLPYHAPNVVLGANTLTWLDNGAPVEVSVPPGHYSPEGFASELERILNLLTASAYSVRFLGSRNRFFVTSAAGAVFGVDATADTADSLSWMMGFPPGAAYVSTAQSYAGVSPADADYAGALVSERPVGFHGDGAMFVEVAPFSSTLTTAGAQGGGAHAACTATWRVHNEKCLPGQTISTKGLNHAIETNIDRLNAMTVRVGSSKAFPAELGSSEVVLEIEVKTVRPPTRA